MCFPEDSSIFHVLLFMCSSHLSHLVLGMICVASQNSRLVGKSLPRLGYNKHCSFHPIPLHCFSTGSLTLGKPSMFIKSCYGRKLMTLASILWMNQHYRKHIFHPCQSFRRTLRYWTTISPGPLDKITPNKTHEFSPTDLTNVSSMR